MLSGAKEFGGNGKWAVIFWGQLLEHNESTICSHHYYFFFFHCVIFCWMKRIQFQCFYFHSMKLLIFMYKNQSNSNMFVFFLSYFLQFVGNCVTRLNETTVVFSSLPVLEDPENYNITTIILMDHYQLVVKNESHSFTYVADPTFENFTDGIKKQVNKLINAKVILLRDDCYSLCPWCMCGIFPFFHKPLTYNEQLFGIIFKILECLTPARW